jgi:hypothetical protein
VALRSASPKCKVENAHLRILCERFLAAHPLCQVCLDLAKHEGVREVTPLITVSRGIQAATQVHHIGRRHGAWLLDTMWFLAVCGLHHDRIEKHGEWARDRGYLLTPEQRRLIIPTPTPI